MVAKAADLHAAVAIKSPSTHRCVLSNDAINMSNISNQYAIHAIGQFHNPRASLQSAQADCAFCLQQLATNSDSGAYACVNVGQGI